MGGDTTTLGTVHATVIEREKETNPFMRAASVEAFAALRAAKDSF